MNHFLLIVVVVVGRVVYLLLGEEKNGGKMDSAHELHCENRGWRPRRRRIKKEEE
jgi:hypothetical protein